MKRANKKQGNHPKQNKKQQVDGTFSLIVPLQSPDDEQFILDSLSALNQQLTSASEVIVASSSGSAAEKPALAIKENLDKTGGYQDVKHASSESATFGALAKAALELASNPRTLIIDFSSLKKKIDLNQVLSTKNQDLEGVVFFNELEAKVMANQKKYYHPAILLDTSLAEYLFGNVSAKDQSYQKELRFMLKKLDVKFQLAGLKQDGLLKQKVKIGSIGNHLKYFGKNVISWFVRIPLKELKTKPERKYAFIKESSVFRLLFFAVALLTFIILPLLSYQTGTSGDEERFQYPQGVRLAKFYETFGQDSSYSTVVKDFETYGMFFDTFTALVVRAFDIDNYFEARHAMNIMTGWLAMLFVSLIVALLAGWRAGFISFLLMLFTPRFLGQAWNNPKDAPFAMAYAFGLLYIIKFIKEFPRPSTSTIVLLGLAIGLGISIRVGGLLLIPILLMIGGLYFLITTPKEGFLSKENGQKFSRLAVYIMGISLLGYAIGVIFWPYAIQNPLKNPFRALEYLSNFPGATLKQLYDGDIIWSDNLPWHYFSKFILITMPTIVLAGAVLFIFMLGKLKNKLNYLFAYLLVFAFVFPLAYIVYKESNVYGGIRHVLFTIPPLVAIAGIGFGMLLNSFSNIKVKFIIGGIIVLLGIHPIIHTFKNHPYQYVYFNELFGGVKNAYGEYELDYYFHSFKEAAEWVLDEIDVENLPAKEDNSEKIRIASNYMLGYYMRNYKDKVSSPYIRYYERGNTDWDYAVIINAYVSPWQLKRKIFPPKNTVHEIKVDGYPICVVLKRENREDLLGYQALQERNYFKAVQHLNNALEYDPNNESALMNLAQAYIQTKQFDKALSTSDRLLKVYPDFDKALHFKGVAYMNMGNFNKAIETFERIIDVNYKFVTAYYNIALVNYQTKKHDTALQYLQKALEVNRGYKPTYYLVAQILRDRGQHEEAQKYIDIANSF